MLMRFEEEGSVRCGSAEQGDKVTGYECGADHACDGAAVSDATG